MVRDFHFAPSIRLVYTPNPNAASSAHTQDGRCSALVETRRGRFGALIVDPSHLLQMRLKLAKPIKGELSGLFREPGQLVDTRRVRQMACRVLRQMNCKVTPGRPLRDA
jgi:hypothetical protein